MINVFPKEEKEKVCRPKQRVEFREGAATIHNGIAITTVFEPEDQQIALNTTHEVREWQPQKPKEAISVKQER